MALDHQARRRGCRFFADHYPLAALSTSVTISKGLNDRIGWISGRWPIATKCFFIVAALKLSKDVRFERCTVVVRC